MKTLVFDLSLKLRGITELEDRRAALADLALAGLVAPTRDSLDPDDWNFLRVEDGIATELATWQTLGGPTGVSPLIDLSAWLRWKEGKQRG